MDSWNRDLADDDFWEYLEPYSSEYFKKTPLGTCVIIGGAGYLGACLAWTLLDMIPSGLVKKVIIIDMIEPPLILANRIGVESRLCTAGTGNGSTGLQSLGDSLWRNVSEGTMFYCASSNPRDLSYANAKRANVDGVTEALAMCRLSGIKVFVYTSSHNVVFDGVRKFRMADEISAPIPLKHMDVYSSTKAQGEKLALAVNGSMRLRTCALRPCGIFGPGERFHYERQRFLALAGLHSIRILPVLRKSMDWVFISNVVDAHVLAAQSLHGESQIGDDARKSFTSGRAFFISENNPAECLQTFFHAMFFASGIRVSKAKMAVPWPLVHVFAYFCELYGKLTLSLPPLTRMEVAKVRIEHTFSSKRANAAFGYWPRVPLAEGIKRCFLFEKSRPRTMHVRDEQWHVKIYFWTRCVIWSLGLFLNVALCLWILSAPLWLAA